MKTHSGAKKRFKKLPGGKVKRGQTKRRHLMNNKNHKTKRNLAGPAYVHSANMDQMARLLLF
jgi:large subunit ribosomal protein L35